MKTGISYLIGALFTFVIVLELAQISRSIKASSTNASYGNVFDEIPIISLIILILIVIFALISMSKEKNNP
ncbi:hypothetical protein [Paenibacillus sp. BK720]|uniref:hypothetical protein n=1 Tax=Paenibacillus sp. BK720 TaxID=2587092 RepID=UPI001ABA9C80|nr:hypothetical protein [Paenibacillus sp. BK720]